MHDRTVNLLSETLLMSMKEGGSECHFEDASESYIEVLVQSNGTQQFESHILNNTSPLRFLVVTYSSLSFSTS